MTDKPSIVDDSTYRLWFTVWNVLEDRPEAVCYICNWRRAGRNRQDAKYALGEHLTSDEHLDLIAKDE